MSIYGETDGFEDALNHVKITVYLSLFNRSVPLIELSREAHKVAE
jgi:hypothetical protein